MREENIEPEIWTPKRTGEELVEAVRWARVAAGSVGPSARMSSSPELLMTQVERLAEGWPGIEELDLPKRPRPYSPARVSQLERALWWPATYLPGHAGWARVLHCWIRCRITRGVKFAQAIEERGWSRPTAYRARDSALSRIAQGLTKNGILRGNH